MSHRITKRSWNKDRPKMAAAFESVDRDHTPHHLRIGELEPGANGLNVGITFSPVGKWAELRIHEYFTKMGSAREQTKVISTTFRDEELRALCAFFAHVAEHLEKGE